MKKNEVFSGYYEAFTISFFSLLQKAFTTCLLALHLLFLESVITFEVLFSLENQNKRQKGPQQKTEKAPPPQSKAPAQTKEEKLRAKNAMHMSHGRFLRRSSEEARQTFADFTEQLQAKPDLRMRNIARVNRPAMFGHSTWGAYAKIPRSNENRFLPE